MKDFEFTERVLGVHTIELYKRSGSYGSKYGWEWRSNDGALMGDFLYVRHEPTQQELMSITTKLIDQAARSINKYLGENI